MWTELTVLLCKIDNEMYNPVVELIRDWWIHRFQCDLNGLDLLITDNYLLLRGHVDFASVF